MAKRKDRRSPSALVANIRDSEHSTAHTWLMVLKNRGLAIGTLKGCCGHPGQPGC